MESLRQRKRIGLETGLSRQSQEKRKDRAVDQVTPEFATTVTCPAPIAIKFGCHDSTVIDLRLRPEGSSSKSGSLPASARFLRDCTGRLAARGTRRIFKTLRDSVVPRPHKVSPN